MTSKKPWRTLISVGDSAGRFTREQVEAAVVKVMGERERKAAAKAARVRKVSGGSASREGDTAKPTKTPARQPRKTPKAA